MSLIHSYASLISWRGICLFLILFSACSQGRRLAKVLEVVTMGNYKSSSGRFFFIIFYPIPTFLSTVVLVKILQYMCVPIIARKLTSARSSHFRISRSIIDVADAGIKPLWSSTLPPTLLRFGHSSPALVFQWVRFSSIYLFCCFSIYPNTGCLSWPARQLVGLLILNSSQVGSSQSSSVTVNPYLTILLCLAILGSCVRNYCERKNVWRYIR